MAHAKTTTEEAIDEFLLQWTQAKQDYSAKLEAFNECEVYSENEIDGLNEEAKGHLTLLYNIRHNPQLMKHNLSALAELSLATKKLLDIEKQINNLTQAPVVPSE